MRNQWKWVAAFAVIVGFALLMSTVGHGNRGITDWTVAQGWGITPVEAAVGWPQWNNPGTKIVPILSIGTPGLRVGAAQVSGPKTLVNRVRAVLQLDAEFKGVRAKILVPSDSTTSLRRVQGTAVTAVLQYKLLGFSSKSKAQPVATKKSCPKKVVKPACPPKKHQDNGRHTGWHKNGKYDHDHSKCGGKR